MCFVSPLRRGHGYESWLCYFLCFDSFTLLVTQFNLTYLQITTKTPLSYFDFVIILTFNFGHIVIFYNKWRVKTLHRNIRDTKQSHKRETRPLQRTTRHINLVITRISKNHISRYTSCLLILTTKVLIISYFPLQSIPEDSSSTCQVYHLKTALKFK